MVDGGEIWRFAADGPIGNGLSAAGNLVYVIDSDGILYAVDIATGSEVWRFDAPVFNTPAVEDGLLVTGSVTACSSPSTPKPAPSDGAIR